MDVFITVKAKLKDDLVSFIKGLGLSDDYIFGTGGDFEFFSEELILENGEEFHYSIKGQIVGSIASSLLNTDEDYEFNLFGQEILSLIAFVKERQISVEIISEDAELGLSERYVIDQDKVVSEEVFFSSIPAEAAEVAGYNVSVLCKESICAYLEKLYDFPVVLSDDIRLSSDKQCVLVGGFRNKQKNKKAMFFALLFYFFKFPYRTYLHNNNYVNFQIAITCFNAKIFDSEIIVVDF